MAEGRLEPELAQQQREVDASLDDLLAQLRAADPASSVARAVGDAYGVYHAAVNDQFQLLARGDLAEAEEVDEQRVDPAFDRLVESLATASRHYGAVAHRANRQADLGTLLLLLAAASVIGVLVWRFQRVKSQAAELFAHQASSSSCTTSRSSTWTAARSATWRPWCAGTTPPADWPPRPTSSLWPRRPA